MILSKSNEDYLEAILMIEIVNESEGGKVRSIDISRHLGVSKPGVSKAMGVLKEAGLIDKESYGDIVLTDKGRKIANDVYKKHLLIKEFLIALGVPKDVAAVDCCKMEHVLSNETVDKMEDFINNRKTKLSI